MHYRYSIMPVTEAIQRYGLAAFVSADVCQLWAEAPEASMQAIVFHGDVAWAEEVDLVFWSDIRHPSALARLILDGPRFIVVEGSLQASRVGTAFLEGFFVLGHLTCQVIEFGTTPTYIQGDLNVEQAMLANAEDDEISDATEEGRTWVRVDGWVLAPVIHTWNFRLHHLRIRPGCGEEIAEELRSPDSHRVPGHYWPVGGTVSTEAPEVGDSVLQA